VSYQVIARKWRPQTFAEVTGQEHVTSALRNAILTDRVPHAMLLTGPRGVGKTTLARILARSLNCDEGPTETPCGQCAPCTEIAAGRSNDVQEVDAASRTGVNDVRELIEAIRYAPSPGKYRIFVVDEVHMLSNPAFNALLKTLEEPPSNSLFVLATTNPEKIPTTVISRCQRHDLRLFATQEVTDRLAQICKAEGIKISEKSLGDLAREGQGSMRDSQTLLDQALAHGGTEIDDNTVSTMLDLVAHRVLFDMIEACIDSKPAAALEICQNALQSGADTDRLGKSLVGLLRDLVVLSVAPNSEGLVEGGEADLEALAALAKRAGTDRLRRMFKALLTELEDLAWAPQPTAILEIALIRLATLPKGEDVAELLERLRRLESTETRTGHSGAPAGGGDRSPPPSSGPPSPEPKVSSPAKPPSHNAPRSSDESSAPPLKASTRTAPSPSPKTQAPKTSEAIKHLTPQDAGGPPLPDDDSGGKLGALFDRLRNFVGKTDQPLSGSLENASLIERTPDSIRIAPGSAFQAKRLEDRLSDLQKVTHEFFNREVTVEIASFAPALSGALQTGSAPARVETERKKIQSALNDPVLNEAIKLLGGEIVKIIPLGKEQPR
jgi:DNA polymerase III subunit gamma/tau